MSEKFLILVQARMGSRRLPGKSLRPLGGKPLLGHALDALEQAFGRNKLMVLSSRNRENDPLAEYLSSRSIAFFRGSEEDVASRFAAVVEAQGLDFFVRVSGDSPLLDHRIVQNCIEVFSRDGCDLATTVGTEVPSGMNCEAVRASTFLSCQPGFTLPEDKEHVTKFFYREQDRRGIRITRCPWPAPGCDGAKFSVDTEQDFAIVSAVFAKLSRPHYELGLAEKCRLMDDARKGVVG